MNVLPIVNITPPAGAGHHHQTEAVRAKATIGRDAGLAQVRGAVPPWLRPTPVDDFVPLPGPVGLVQFAARLIGVRPDFPNQPIIM